MLSQFIHILTDPLALIKLAGIVGVICIVFAESGLFFGFFFPGDSLLFTAGFLASQGLLSFGSLSPLGFLGMSSSTVGILLFFIAICIAAIAGDSVGYMFGARVGHRIFSKENSFFFNKKYPEQAQIFYEKYGKKTIILARFIPIVRTFAPIVAGVGHMKYSVFFVYNVVGGVLWTFLLVGSGYILGRTVPQANHYISLIVVIIIVLSVLPPVIHLIREKRGEKNKNI